MSDHQRRFVCRSLFLMVCLVPTLGIFAWAVSFHLPGAAEREAARLMQSLGLKVRFLRAERPVPGTVIYHECRLFDPELETPVAELDRLEIIRSDVTTILVDQAQVTAAGGPALWANFQENLKHAQSSPWELHVEHLRLAGRKKSHALANFRARGLPGVTGTTVNILFQAPGQAGSDVQLNLARSRQAPSPATTWEMKTSGALSVELLEMLMPAWQAFGHAATFRGVVTSSRTDGASNGCDVRGTIDQIDLEQLATGVMPGAISGMAKLEVDHAQIRDGRLISASATLQAGPGRIRAALLQALAETWELDTGPGFGELSEVESFEQLGLAIGMNSRGLLIRGQCQRSSPATLLVSMRGPLLRTREPEHPLLAVTSLLQIVDPVAGAWAFTPEVQRLARVLPLASSRTQTSNP